MDKYFYIIEQDECGNKYFHLEGNIYYNDADESDTCYRVAEWTFLYLTIDEAIDMMTDDTFFDYVYERVSYLKDITEQQAKDMCADFFDGQPGAKLNITDINDSTPCGCYWFE